MTWKANNGYWYADLAQRIIETKGLVTVEIPHPKDHPYLQFMMLSDDLTALFQTNADTSPVTAVDQAVGRWRNSYGPATMIFDQGTAGARPLYNPTGEASLGTLGVPTVYFAGTDDVLIHTEANAFSTHASGTIIWWGRIDSAVGGANTNTLFCSSDTGASNRYLRMHAATDDHFYCDVQEGAVLESQGGDGFIGRESVMTIYTATNDGANTQLYMNGTNDDLGPGFGALWFSGVTLRDNVALGAKVDNIPNDFLVGAMGGMAYFYPHLPYWDIRLVEQWIRDKYNTPPIVP